MCFYISDRYIGVRVAEKDIECLKVLKVQKKLFRKRYKSLVYDYEYFKGRDCPRVEIHEGVGLDDFGRFKSFIYAGYHSWKLLPELYLKNLDYRVSVKFVIPKGTKYYENDHEYVSEVIRMVEVIE